MSRLSTRWAFVALAGIGLSGLANAQTFTFESTTTDQTMLGMAPGTGPSGQHWTADVTTTFADGSTTASTLASEASAGAASVTSCARSTGTASDPKAQTQAAVRMDPRTMIAVYRPRTVRVSSLAMALPDFTTIDYGFDEIPLEGLETTTDEALETPHGFEIRSIPDPQALPVSRMTV